MKTVRRPLANDMLYRRIDEMRMGWTDRELAKSRLRTGERLAEALCEIGGAIRSCAAFVARHVRTAVVAS